ncbi:MAG: beta-propeller domain-containing protein, partial [Bacteroidota bacterium]
MTNFRNLKFTTTVVGKIALVFFLCLNTAFAQVGINSDNSDPDNSAMLDVKSTEKGILIPRMDSTSRQNITSPAVGLMVYDTTTSTFWYYTTQWTEITADNLGNHTANQNIQTNGFYLSNDGEDEGIWIDETGNVGIGNNTPTDFLEVTLGGGTVTSQKIIDNIDNNTIESIATAWQSYTAILDGTLGIIYLPDGGLASPFWTVTIHEGEGDTGNVLGTVSASNTFDFSSLNIPQIAGETYTFSITIGGGQFTPYSNSGYSGGVSSLGTGVDLSFELYINSTTSGRFTAGANGVQINDYTLPASDGSANQFLQTDGAGNLSWTEQVTPTDNQTIDQLTLSGTTLEISLEDDNQATQTLDLSPVTSALTPENLLNALPEPDFSCLEILGSVTTDVANDVVVLGDYMYVLDPTDRLRIVDVSDKSNPTIVSNSGVGNAPSGLAVAGDHVYVVSNSTDNLRVIDVSDKTSPSTVGTVSLIDPKRVTVLGDHAYVADGSSLGIVDISDKTTPSVTASLDLGGTRIESIFVLGDYAYLLDDGLNNFHIVDVSDVINPIEVATPISINGPTSVYVSGDYAYVTSGGSQPFRIYDVSDKSNPMLVSAPTLSGGIVNEVAVVGDYAYLIKQGSPDQLLVLDVSDKANPSVSTSISIDDIPNALAISGNYAYITYEGSFDTDIIQLSCDDLVAFDVVGGAFGSVSDNQTIDKLNLNGTTLEISLEGDGESDQTVDLASLDTDTDNQTIDKLNLNGTTLEISLEDDGESDQTVDLASLDTDTDDQTLSLNGSTLSIADGNSV